MCSNDDRESIVAVLERYEAAAAQLAGVGFEALTTGELLAVAERLERVSRRHAAIGHELINRLDRFALCEELGGTLADGLADRLRISGVEARRRIGEAADLGTRVALSGEVLAPRLQASAAAARAGLIGAEHVRVIRRFLAGLPGWVDPATRERAQVRLAELSTQFRPDQVNRAAAVLANLINPDGDFCDEDRARRRSVLIGAQGPDGMSPMRGWLTPELRAGLEAVLAKWAAPGMCNPTDQTATTDGQPDEQARQHDARSSAQRNHDALTAMVRTLLCSGQLGSHRGLPVSIIVTARLTDLETQTGVGVTGGGSVLPMGDVIRLARHAHHYLAIFDGRGRPLWLGHTKRLASADQRIVLHAFDRGCSFPGCHAPGYLSEVHHVQDWAAGGRTDIDELTFACKAHNLLIQTSGWTTRKRADGRTQWIPPPHLDRGQPRTNTFHHPEELLREDDHDDDVG